MKLVMINSGEEIDYSKDLVKGNPYTLFLDEKGIKLTLNDDGDIEIRHASREKK